MDNSTDENPDTAFLIKREEDGAPAKIVLAVRFRLFREGLRRLLREADFETQAEVATPDEISSLEAIPDPSQVILAIVEASFCFDGNDFLVRLRQMLPAARIVLLARADDLLKLADVPLDLVDSVISSEVSGSLLMRYLRLVLPGHCVVSLEFMRSLLDSRAGARSGASGEPIAEEQAPSRREAEILRCLIDGYSNKVIARQLGITEATVKVHLKGLLRKIRAENRTQAAIWALNKGFHGASSTQSEVVVTPGPSN
jgi:two-component system, NarL family, nitrate/nitrite response regulator NarL